MANADKTYTVAETGQVFTHDELREQTFAFDADATNRDADERIAFDVEMGSLIDNDPPMIGAEREAWLAKYGSGDAE